MSEREPEFEPTERADSEEHQAAGQPDPKIERDPFDALEQVAEVELEEEGE